eukprot:2811610-Karenia_brevis.AAC.1
MILQFAQHRSPLLLGLHCLLSSHKVALNPDGGLSWLELFVLSLALTVDPIALSHGHGSVACRTIAALTCDFVTTARQFVHFALPPHFHTLFASPG